MCRSGFPNACIPLFTNPDAPGPGWPLTPGQWWDGAMAKFVRVPAHYAYPISDRTPMWHAAVLEPIGCVVNGMRKLCFEAGESAVVLGAGPIGLLFVSILKASGASKIIVSESVPLRGKAAAECGAHVVVNPTKENLEEIVLAETQGEGVDVVIDAVGWLFPLSIELVRFGGRVLLFGVDSTARPQVPPLVITCKEIQVTGVFLMKYTMPAAITLLESGLLPMDKIVTHRLPLEKVHEGLQLASSGKGIKVVLTPTEL